jgi:hypothetical protein
VNDLNWRERIALAPLLVFIVWIGVWPGTFLAKMSGTLGLLTEPAKVAFDARYGKSAIQNQVVARFQVVARSPDRAAKSPATRVQRSGDRYTTGYAERDDPSVAKLSTGAARVARPR